MERLKLVSQHVTSPESAPVLWRPKESYARTTKMYAPLEVIYALNWVLRRKFRQLVQQKFDSDVDGYEALHKWSVENLGQDFHDHPRLVIVVFQVYSGLCVGILLG